MPSIGPDSATLNTGSALLTMCAKLTAIWLKLTHADTWPMVWNSATGSSACRGRRKTQTRAQSGAVANATGAGGDGSSLRVHMLAA